LNNTATTAAWFAKEGVMYNMKIILWPSSVSHAPSCALEGIRPQVDSMWTPGTICQLQPMERRQKCQLIKMFSFNMSGQVSTYQTPRNDCDYSYI
jgi:hypothetical protein